MFKNILVPTDGSALSDKALKAGVALAKALGATVIVLHVMRPWSHGGRPGMVEGLRDDFDHLADLRARDAFAAAVNAGLDTDFPVTTEQVFDLNPYEAIIRTATAKGCDLIFMSSHGRRGLEGLIIGSETSKVLTHCTIPVIVHR